MLFDEIIPAFDAHAVFVSPWTDSLALHGWVVLMGFLVCLSCGWIGTFLVLRRIALVGDAISHSLLPGIAIAFWVSASKATLPLFLGALAAGFATTMLIEAIHRHSRIKPDAALAIVFSTLFAIGVILINSLATHVDLDADCVLYGEIGFVALDAPAAVGPLEMPRTVARMLGVTLATLAFVTIGYRALLTTSFDVGLARSIGWRVNGWHYGLMGGLSIVVVSAFESVGAILVIAMLILPSATALLWTDRLPRILLMVVPLAAVYSVGGRHLALWLNAAEAASMVVVAATLFGLSWLAAPHRGLIARGWRRHRNTPPGAPETDEPPPADEAIPSHPPRQRRKRPSGVLAPRP